MQTCPHKISPKSALANYANNATYCRKSLWSNFGFFFCGNIRVHEVKILTIPHTTQFTIQNYYAVTFEKFYHAHMSLSIS